MEFCKAFGQDDYYVLASMVDKARWDNNAKWIHSWFNSSYKDFDFYIFKTCKGVFTYILFWFCCFMFLLLMNKVIKTSMSKLCNDIKLKEYCTIMERTKILELDSSGFKFHDMYLLCATSVWLTMALFIFKKRIIIYSS